MKRVSKQANRHSWLFLLETAIAMGIFAVSASVFILVFVQAKEKELDAEILHTANLEMQNTVELIRSCDTEEAMLETLQENYEMTAITTGYELRWEDSDRSESYILWEYEVSNSMVQGKLHFLYGEEEVLTLEILQDVNDSLM